MPFKTYNFQVLLAHDYSGNLLKYKTILGQQITAIFLLFTQSYMQYLSSNNSGSSFSNISLLMSHQVTKGLEQEAVSPKIPIFSVLEIA